MHEVLYLLHKKLLLCYSPLRHRSSEIESVSDYILWWLFSLSSSSSSFYVHIFDVKEIFSFFVFFSFFVWCLLWELKKKKENFRREMRKSLIYEIKMIKSPAHIIWRLNPSYQTTNSRLSNFLLCLSYVYLLSSTAGACCRILYLILLP